MFCSKCGAQLPDASKFCAECGAALSMPDFTPGPGPMPGPGPDNFPGRGQGHDHFPGPMPGPGPEQFPGQGDSDKGGKLKKGKAAKAPKDKKPLNPKLIIGIIAAAAAVALIVLAIVFVPKIFMGSQKKAEQVLVNSMEACLDLDFKKAMKAYPDELVDALCQNSYGVDVKTLASMFQEQADAAVDSFDEYGLNLKKILSKFDVEVISSSKIEDSALESLKADWNQAVPGLGDQITKAYSVSAKYVANSDMQVEIWGKTYSLAELLPSGTVSCVVAKIDGGWYILDERFVSLGLFL